MSEGGLRSSKIKKLPYPNPDRQRGITGVGGGAEKGEKMYLQKRTGWLNTKAKVRKSVTTLFRLFLSKGAKKKGIG